MDVKEDSSQSVIEADRCCPLSGMCPFGCHADHENDD